MSVENHLTGRAIANRMNISRPTVSNILKRFQETGGVEERAGRGRKRKVCKQDAEKMVKKAKKGRSASEISRDYSRTSGQSISEITVEEFCMSMAWPTSK